MQIHTMTKVRPLTFSPTHVGAFGTGWQPAPRGMAFGLMQRLGEHHPGTLTHSVQVARLTLLMWALAPAWLGPREGVMLSGLLHDIGKLFVPSELLSADHRLSDAEFAVMAEHPGRGALLLRQMGFADGVVAAAHEHHERWSGDGYPTGRPAKLLSPLSRAVATADAFSAMIEPRSYCRALTVEQGLAELAACRGGQFDPATVDLLHTGMEGWARQAKPEPGRWLDAELDRPKRRSPCHRQNGGQS